MTMSAAQHAPWPETKPSAVARFPLVETDRLKRHVFSVAGVAGGESSTREALVLLPDGYHRQAGRRYPTLYLLHGFGFNSCGPNFWFSQGYAPGLDLRVACQGATSESVASEMIFVCPDGGNSLGGSMWEDSPVSGAVQRWIVDELPAFIDSAYRTYDDAAMRGVAGHSMGGQAAVKIALKFPHRFASAYSMSGMMGFSYEQLRRYGERWRDQGAPAPQDIDPDVDEHSSAYVAMSSAFCWRHDSESFSSLFLVDGSLHPMLADCFLDEWPIEVLRAHGANVRKLRGLALDIGINDEFTWGLESNRAFTKALQEFGAPFLYEEYEGSHSSMLAARFRTHVIPFFARLYARQDGER